MEKSLLIKKLIDVKEPWEYHLFVIDGITTLAEIEDLKSRLRDSGNNKHISLLTASYEMSFVRRTLKNFNLYQPLPLIRYSQKYDKPHIGVEILKPEDKLGIVTEIPLPELEILLTSFLSNLSCHNFKQGVCINSCDYRMPADENVNCSRVNRTAYKVLRKYYGSGALKILGRLQQSLT